MGADYLSELFEKYCDVGIVLMVYHGEKNAATKDYKSIFGTIGKGIDLEGGYYVLCLFPV